jgi:hypothetical protein
MFCWWLLVAILLLGILLVAIGGHFIAKYSICGYWWPFYCWIFYWWLLVAILLLNILLVTIGGYFIVGYFIGDYW